MPLDGIFMFVRNTLTFRRGNNVFFIWVKNFVYDSSRQNVLPGLFHLNSDKYEYEMEEWS